MQVPPPPPPSPPPAAATSSASSSSSSPSYEFSFTASLDSTASSWKPRSHDIDLSPADEIFFHGHLLPLHLLSHLSFSPRPSTDNLLDTFTLPREYLLDGNPIKTTTIEDSECEGTSHANSKSGGANLKKGVNSKPKPFSLFRLVKSRNRFQSKPESDADVKKHKQSDPENALKRYVKSVRKFLLQKKGEKRVKSKQEARPSSYSGSLNAYTSAPASTRSSPRNSGHLVAAPCLRTVPSDSSMEELQAAIEAAIAHCKNSISAVDDEGGNAS